MKILFDTNIVLDLLLDRKPVSDDAALLFAEVHRAGLTGYLCSHTITVVYDLAHKAAGRRTAQEQIKKLMMLFEIASINRNVLEGALDSKFDDFGDAIIHESARLVDSYGIVTRDSNGFRSASISVYSPKELVGIIRARDKNR